AEVRKLLAAVKLEFAKFGAVLENVKKKLDQASTTMDAAAQRSRAIERRLRDVEDLPGAEPSRVESQAWRGDTPPLPRTAPILPIVPALAFCLPALADPPARPSVAEVLAQLHRLVKPKDVAISPDGRHVAWVEQMVTPDGPASKQSIIYVADRTQPERAPQ